MDSKDLMTAFVFLALVPVTSAEYCGSQYCPGPCCGSNNDVCCTIENYNLGRLSIGVILGIAIGVIVGFVVLVSLIINCCKKCCKRGSQSTVVHPQPTESKPQAQPQPHSTMGVTTAGAVPGIALIPGQKSAEQGDYPGQPIYTPPPVYPGTDP